MKIKEGFVRREVAGNNVVVAVGKTAENFGGMIKLNDTGCFIWKKLESGTTAEELVKEMTEVYDVDESAASAGIRSFIKELEKIGCLEK